MQNAKQSICVMGQVLSLAALLSSQLCHPDSESSQSTNAAPLSQYSLAWLGGYVKSKSDVARTEQYIEKPVSLTVPGHLCTALDPGITFVSRCHFLELSDSQCCELNTEGLIWVFPLEALAELTTVAWEWVKAVKVTPGSLQNVKPINPDLFLYRAGACLCDSAMQMLKTTATNITAECVYCGQTMGRANAA